MTEPSLSKSSDVDLLSRIAAGEVDALTLWFHLHKDAIYSFVYYRVGNDPELAADATQSTFTAALERLEEFDAERGEMITWLRYLSRNIIRRLLATHQRGEQLQVVWDHLDDSLRAAYERIDHTPMPEAVLQREETRELVQMALANLPPQYRDALEEKYVQNQPLATMAELRSSSLDSVKSMLHRSRAAFRECFLAMAKIKEISDV